MDESKTTTETVVQKSAGQVKITVEEYNDLQRRANEPKQIYNPIVNHIEKTPEMQALDLIAVGSVCMGGGATLFLFGAITLIVGKKKLAAL